MNDLVIRPLSGRAERQACVALQERVWGFDFADRVPASVLMIARETGGVVSGAFEGDRLVGFVFGITGVEDGRPIHWSDMLAVEPTYRGRGIGFRLKLHQREQLLAMGVRVVRWTFDPLEAGNAYLNLRRLGATAAEYRRDAYGASDSPLHAGIGTDRLVAEWLIASDRVAERLRTESPRAAEGVGESPLLNPPILAGGAPRPSPTILEPRSDTVRVAVPTDIQALKRTDLATAVEWRKNVRTALERALETGYTAVDLERGEPMARYVLTRSFAR